MSHIIHYITTVSSCRMPNNHKFRRTRAGLRCQWFVLLSLSYYHTIIITVDITINTIVSSCLVYMYHSNSITIIIVPTTNDYHHQILITIKCYIQPTISSYLIHVAIHNFIRTIVCISIITTIIIPLHSLSVYIWVGGFNMC